MKTVIIGGVAGGASCAARLRRLNENDEIIIIEKGPYISYANCGLPYYLSGTIAEEGSLLVTSVAAMKMKFNVEARVNNEAIKINPDKKEVVIKDILTEKEYTEKYDNLVLSCGAKAFVPPFKGLDKADNVFVLKTVTDTIAVKNYMESHDASKAVVVGGGFIGIETAENLREAGLEVTIVEKQNQVLSNIDFDMAQMVHRELNNNGIKLKLGVGLEEILKDGKQVKLDTGETLDTDLIIMSIGIKPVTDLLKDYQLGKRGHAIVNEVFNVLDKKGKEVEGVYAVGDMIEVISQLDNTTCPVPLAWGANRQGKLLADHLAGKRIKKSIIQGSSVIKVFGLTIASTGANEKTLKAKKIDYVDIYSVRPNHASYYPGASLMALKVMYDKKTGRIYGAQAVGGAGAEKRIDTLVACMRLNGTIYDLSDMEFCYAPPYSSAKDPVNIAGYIAENIKDGYYKQCNPNEIDAAIAKGAILFDVRPKASYDAGHIPTAKHLPMGTIRENLDKLPKKKDTPIYLHCRIGYTSYLALQVLRGAGYTNLYNVSGGFTLYSAHAYKVK